VMLGGRLEEIQQTAGFCPGREQNKGRQPNCNFA